MVSKNAPRKVFVIYSSQEVQIWRWVTVLQHITVKCIWFGFSWALFHLFHSLHDNCCINHSWLLYWRISHMGLVWDLWVNFFDIKKKWTNKAGIQSHSCTHQVWMSWATMGFSQRNSHSHLKKISTMKPVPSHIQVSDWLIWVWDLDKFILYPKYLEV